MGVILEKSNLDYVAFFECIFECLLVLKRIIYRAPVSWHKKRSIVHFLVDSAILGC
jgi:hypothetical protein